MFISEKGAQALIDSMEPKPLKEEMKMPTTDQKYSRKDAARAWKIDESDVIPRKRKGQPDLWLNDKTGATLYMEEPEVEKEKAELKKQSAYYESYMNHLDRMNKTQPTEYITESSHVRKILTEARWNEVAAKYKVPYDDKDNYRYWSDKMGMFMQQKRITGVPNKDHTEIFFQDDNGYPLVPFTKEAAAKKEKEQQDKVESGRKAMADKQKAAEDKMTPEEKAAKKKKDNENMSKYIADFERKHGSFTKGT